MVRRLKPGQYDPKTGRLKKNPEYEGDPPRTPTPTRSGTSKTPLLTSFENKQSVAPKTQIVSTGNDSANIPSLTTEKGLISTVFGRGTGEKLMRNLDVPPDTVGGTPPAIGPAGSAIQAAKAVRAAAEVAKVAKAERVLASEFQKAKKITEIQRLMETSGTLKSFSLKGLVKAKGGNVDLDYMFRLGEYSPPVPGQTLNIASNTKNLKLVEQLLTKKGVFNAQNKKLMLALGISGAVASWAGMVFWGKWGQAEAPEPINILLTSKLVPEAVKTGDWALVDQARELRDSIIPNVFEAAVLWSPVSPLIGNKAKTEGAAYAGLLTDLYVEDKKIQQANGESEEEMWNRIHADEDKRLRDYTDWKLEQERIGNSERLESQKLFNKAERKEDKALAKEIINMWDEYDLTKNQRSEERLANELKLRLDYHKLLLEMNDENRPSKLTFGLL